MNKANETQYKDQKMNKMFAILGTFVVTLFVIYMLDWNYVIKNSEGLDYHGDFSGKVDKIRTSKGTTFLKLENEKMYWMINPSVNQALEPSGFCDFIQKNDSIIKESFKRKLTIKRNQKEYIFQIGLTDYNSGLEIQCDSIYQTKGYRIEFDANTINSNEYNSIFRLYTYSNGKKSEIRNDSIYSTTFYVKFEDFNNDSIQDILIQNNTDSRSNWTYYLFLVDTISNRIQKINGFENIKNPEFLPKYNLIYNYVNSGQPWTSLYKIHNENIIDYGIVIYDLEDESGINHYDFRLKNAIDSIIENNR